MTNKINGVQARGEESELTELAHASYERQLFEVSGMSVEVLHGREREDIRNYLLRRSELVNELSSERSGIVPRT